MKKYLPQIGLFLGTFVVINVGMYFVLMLTQPKSAVLDSALNADSLHAVAGDSLHVAVADSLHEGEHAETAADSNTHATDSSAHGNDNQQLAVADSSVKVEQTQAMATTPAQDTTKIDSSSSSAALAEDAAAADTTTVNGADGETVEQPKSTAEIAKLAKLLEGMKPNEAAVIAERLPTETIVQLVMRMKSRSGAKMMASLPVPVAASVASRMAEMSGAKNPS